MWRNGTYYGKGTLYYKNGKKKYEGEFMWHKFHFKNITKKGIFYYKNGNKYVGQFKHGKLSGIGTLYYKNGNKYVGEWWRNNFYDKGTLHYKNGNKYVGKWYFNNFYSDGEKKKINVIKGLVCESEWKNCKEIIINHGISRTNQVQERPLVCNKEKLINNEIDKIFNNIGEKRKYNYNEVKSEVKRSKK